MIYFITDGEFVKIGYTDNEDLAPRLAALQTANARELRVVGTIPGGADVEATLHRVFGALRVRGEWFALAVPEDIVELADVVGRTYECVCGRVFTKPQSYSAHTRSCKILRPSSDGYLIEEMR